MKNLIRQTSGFTLAELMVATAVVGITGGMLFIAIHTISMLTVQNSGINFTHQQARETIHRTMRQIHESVSIPQLLDSNLQPLTGAAANGPAPAVGYQVVFAGPYKVWNNANATSTNIRITTRPGDPPPTPGMRLIVPAFQIESDIVDVGGVPGYASVRDIRLANPLGVSIVCAAGTPTFVAYYTQRSALAVANGELRYYKQLSNGSYVSVVRNLASTTPFSVPGGDNRFVRIDFSVRDPRAAARGFKAVDLQLNLTVPYRYRLTTRQ